MKSRHWSLVLFGSILVYTVLLVVTAQNYSQDARIFPFMTGVILIGMLLVKLALITLEERIDLGSVGLFNDVSQFVEGEEEVDRLSQYRSEFVMITWIVGLLVLIWLIGFQLSIVAFVFTYIYVHERDLLRAGSITVGTWLFVYLVFIFLLEAPLFEGVLTPEFLKEVLP